MTIKDFQTTNYLHLICLFSYKFKFSNYLFIARTSSTESDQKVTLAMADLMKPGSSVTAEPQTPQKSDDATPVVAEAPSTPKIADTPTSSPPNDEESTPPAKKAKKRCGVCRKKLGLTG